MSTVASFRWARFVDARSGRGLIVPLDHGLTSGPLDGIAPMSSVRKWIQHPAVNGVILHKGFAERLQREGMLNGKAVCIQLNGATTLAPRPACKEQLTRVDAAIRLGADAVSLDLEFDGNTDAANLRLVGAVVDEAATFQIPLLVMLKSLHPGASVRERALILRQLSRSMAELGARAVKLPRLDDLDCLAELLDGIVEDVDVFFAGGGRGSDQSLIEFVAQALQGGARGFCFGRNVFQSSAPEMLLDRLNSALHDRYVRPSVVAGRA